MNRNVLIGLALVGVIAIVTYFVMSTESTTSIRENSAQDAAEEAEVQVISPAESKVLVTPAPSSNVYFFLENSESIYGYLHSSSHFIATTRRMLYDLENKFAITTYYINTAVYPSGKQLNKFVNQLNSSGIQKGNQSTSDLTYMFEEAIKKTEFGGVSILISDGIYSVPAGSPSELIAQLENEALRTRNKLLTIIQSRNLMTVVVKMNSAFKGNYFPAAGGKLNINQSRPYYIWIFGSPSEVEQALETIQMEQLPGYEHHVKYFRTNDMKPSYSILTGGDEKIGDFRKDPKNQNPLTKSVIQSRKSNHGNTSGSFGFGLAVDFSEIYVPKDNLIDTGSYSTTPNNYELLSVAKVDSIDIHSKPWLKSLPFKPTHILSMKSLGAYLGEVSISLLDSKPNWISESSNLLDTKIKGDTSTTFGFEILMSSFFEAYDILNKKKDIVTLKVEIRK